MKKSELLKKIEAAKDDEDINNLLKGTDIEETFKGEEPTLDVFKGKIKSDKVFQQFMDSEKDTYHTKAMKTLKEKGTWETEFGDVLKEKYPDLVKDPKDKEMLEMKNKIAQMEKEAARKDLLADAMKYAAEKKLPSGFVERFLGDDMEATKTNLDGFADAWSKGLESAVNEKMKGSSYIPGTGDDGKPISIGSSLAAQANKTSSATSDPWAN